MRCWVECHSVCLWGAGVECQFVSGVSGGVSLGVSGLLGGVSLSLWGAGVVSLSLWGAGWSVSLFVGCWMECHSHIVVLYISSDL